MTRSLKLAALVVGSLVAFACSKYYLQSNLNTLAVGTSKAAFLQHFPDTSAIQGPLLRAAQQNGRTQA